MSSIEEVEYTEQFSPKQIEATKHEWQNPQIKEICNEGGARAGKTFLTIRAIIDRAVSYPGSRHLIARYRYNHMITTVWKQTLVPLLNQIVKKDNYREDRQYCIITLSNGSTIWGAGLDDAERVEKIMGSEYSTIFVNEATQISYETFQKLKTRLSLKVVNEYGIELNRKMIIDCNPRNEFHWIYKYFILRKDPNNPTQALRPEQVAQISHRKWFPIDNPFLPPDYLEILNNLTGVERQRLLEGQWVSQEGLVYPNFQDCLVEPFPIPDTWQVVGSVDFGYTNPFAFLWLAYDQSNETYYCYEEYYQRERTVREHCIELRKRKKPDWIVADHDAEDRATMLEEGFETSPAQKDITTGIQAVTQLMNSKNGIKLKIFRSCVNLIEELSVYMWEKSKDGKNEKEVPVKFMDHSLDALRYVCKEIVSPGRVEASVVYQGDDRRGVKTGQDIAKLRKKRMGIFN